MAEIITLNLVAAAYLLGIVACSAWRFHSDLNDRDNKVVSRIIIVWPIIAVVVIIMASIKLVIDATCIILKKL